MISARRQFLDAFLGALGAAEIVECLERATEISGTLRYAEDFEVVDLIGDEGELQGFAWRVAETHVPPVGDGEFDAALVELFAIEVPMLEDGVETGDAFFIRE
ncbi:MAG: hypothetical protein ACREKL_00925 [Chthoniobacterales bacterium]